jgi:hypothetical protein
MIKVHNKNKQAHQNENNINNRSTSQSSFPQIKKEEEVEKKTDFLYLENMNLIKNYGPNVYQYSTEIEKEVVVKKLFERHKLDEKIRTKMVDWMIEVLTAYKSDTQTFFLSVTLMDMYIKKSPTVLDNSHIHLLGITCMYMMSKFEDVIPIRISSVYQKISHRAFSE